MRDEMGKVSKKTIEKVLDGLLVSMYDAGNFTITRTDIQTQKEEFINDIFIRIKGQDTPYWKKKPKRMPEKDVIQEELNRVVKDEDARKDRLDRANWKLRHQTSKRYA